MATTKTPTETNNYGFPIVTCTRCQGRGIMEEYRGSFGGVCYKCNGARKVVRGGKAAKAWEAFRAAIPKKEIVWKDLTAGVDRIPSNGKWTLVTEVAISDEVCGWHIINAGTDHEVREPAAYRATITLADGTTHKGTTHTLTRRCVTAEMYPDPAPYLATI